MDLEGMDLVLGVDPGTRHMGLAFVDKHTNIAVIDDEIEIFVGNGYDHKYEHYHYPFVASELLRKYEAFMQHCSVMISEKIVLQIEFINKDVMVFMGCFATAVRCRYPNICMLVGDSIEIRRFWHVTVKRSKAESKKTSDNKKRLQNKKKSLEAAMMSSMDKMRYLSKFKIDVMIQKGKNKGKIKKELVYDAWDACMIAMYGIHNLEKLQQEQAVPFTRRIKCSRPSIHRLRNIQLTPPPPPSPEIVLAPVTKKRKRAESTTPRKSRARAPSAAPRAPAAAPRATKRRKKST